MRGRNIRRWQWTRFTSVQKEGPISKYRLRELLGGDVSEAALDRALDELWAKLRITRVDYKQDEGVFWDVLFRWSPEAVKARHARFGGGVADGVGFEVS